MSETHLIDGSEAVQVEGFDGYWVTKAGFVYSSKQKQSWPPRRLSLRLDSSGYPIVALARDGKMHTVKVHRLVLEAFAGSCPDAMECCHNDGDKCNNSLDNLRWDSRSANQLDRFTHAPQSAVSGERHGQAKLSNADVAALRRLSSCLSFAELGRRFGISRWQARNIVLGTSR